MKLAPFSLGLAAAASLVVLGLVAGTDFRRPVTVEIVDGDTVRIPAGRVRLQGFNAPETFYARCEEEKALGERAKDRLRQLVDRGAQLRVTEGRCGWGRLCGVMTIRGVNVGEIMIAEGLAEPYVCEKRCPQQRDWCAAARG